MQVLKLVFLLFISLIFSGNNSTIEKTRSPDRGRVVDLRDSNDSKILSYSGSYALLIGQSDYTYWWDLNSISSELNDVESVLKDQGFVVERYSNLNSRQLNNTFKDFIDKYGLDKDNRLLFFYSGHGHSRGDKGYIVPVDAPNPYSDEKGFIRKAIAMNQVVTWAQNIESKHALFLFDSCFSGTIFKSKNIPKLQHISRAIKLPVRQFITAGSANEVVPAKSIFTPFFVNALRYAYGDTNKDGYITGMELGMYLWNQVPNYTNQTPQFGKIKDVDLSAGDFVFKVGTKTVVTVSEKPVATIFAKPVATVSEKPPHILWHKKIGIQTWRNNPIIIGNYLVVGSSGHQWNKPDPLDGIYAFDIRTGKQLWFIHSQNDFNDLAYMEGLIVGGSDAGEVFAIFPLNGKIKWQQKLDGKIYAKPSYLEHGVAIATGNGKIFYLDLKNGKVKHMIQLNGKIRAGMAANGSDLWVATESGWIYNLSMMSLGVIRKFKIFYPDYYSHKLMKYQPATAMTSYYLSEYENEEVESLKARFYAAPLILKDKIIFGFIRDSEHDYPAVVAINYSNYNNYSLAWFGSDDKKQLGDSFGNIRSRASEYKELLIFGNPYSNKAYALSKKDGTLVWKTSLGQPMYQHWSSPVVHRDDVYIARHDGYLHKLHAKDGKRIWSIFLGDKESAGLTFFSEQDLLEENFRTQWSPLNSSSIFATPAVSGKYIAIGTDKGYLYVITQ